MEGRINCIATSRAPSLSVPVPRPLWTRPGTILPLPHDLILVSPLMDRSLSTGGRYPHVLADLFPPPGLERRRLSPLPSIRRLVQRRPYSLIRCSSLNITVFNDTIELSIRVFLTICDSGVLLHFPTNMLFFTTPPRNISFLWMARSPSPFRRSAARFTSFVDLIFQRLVPIRLNQCDGCFPQ